MSRKLALSVVLLLAGASAGAQDASTELEPITVEPLINPLDESLERLRRMMEDAPCLGCGPTQDVVREHPFMKYGRFVSFFTGAGFEPPQLTPQERAEARVAGDWRQYERDPIR